MDLAPGPFMRMLARRLDTTRPGGVYLTVGLAGAFVFLGAFLAIAEDVVEPLGFARLDAAMAACMAAVANPVLTRVMWVATLVGDTWLVAVLASLLVFAWGHPRRAAWLAGMTAAAPALSECLKGFFLRPRPPGADALIGLPDSASFPSGHAISSLVFGGCVVVLILLSRMPGGAKAWGVVSATLVAVLVGVSRVYLGVHWFSDVLASWMLGSAMLIAGAMALLAWERATVWPPVGVPALSGPLRGALVAAAAIVEVIAVTMQAGANPLR